MSGRASLYSRRASVGIRRSCLSLRGTTISLAPAARSLSTTKEPRKPCPPVTTTRRVSQKPMCPQLPVICKMGTEFLVRRLALQRLSHPSHGILPTIPRPDLFFQDRLASARRLQPQRFDVGIHHDGHQVMEFNARFPTQRSAAFCSVGDQSIDFQRTKVTVGNFHMLLPLQSGVGESPFHKFLYRVRFSSADNKIIRGVLLHNLPHSFHVFGCITPVAARFEIAEIQRIFFAGQNICDPACNFSGDESFAAS